MESSTLASERFGYAAEFPQHLARLLLQSQHIRAILHFLPRGPEFLAMIVLGTTPSLDMEIACTADIVNLGVSGLWGKLYEFS